jgi:hypothetical protein
LVLAKKNLEKNSEVLEARHIISYMFPTPSPSKTYCAQQESNITIKSYRIAASIIANHLLSANTKHFYANSWHERYFYETSNYAQESYAQSYTGLKKLLAKRAGEALYLGDEKLACRLNKHELVQMRALINSGVCSLQLAEDDLMEELSNQQVHGNAASALARKAYKEVKFLLSEHWDELEKLAQKLISNNEIHQDELTSLLGAVTSDSEVLDLIH